MSWTSQDGQPVPFRYEVSPMQKVNTFEPKPLQQGADWMALRYSVLGAAAADHFHELPSSSNCSLLWEAATICCVCCCWLIEFAKRTYLTDLFCLRWRLALAFQQT